MHGTNNLFSSQTCTYIHIKLEVKVISLIVNGQLNQVEFILVSKNLDH